MDTNRNLVASSNAVSTAMQRLSSGLRINTAADDAAGYAISQGLTSQVNGFDQASRNVGDAVSMVQTAESSLNNVQSMLQRVRELAVQYQNGDLGSTDKTDIQNEVNQLTQEVDRQRGAVTFNGINLLNGTAGGTNGVTFQVGANSGDTLSASFADVEGSTGLGVTGFSWSQAASGGAVFDLSQANALSTLDAAIGNISNLAANAWCSPEPTAVHLGRDFLHQGEPVRFEQPHPGRRHGFRDDDADPAADPAAGRHRDARSGELAAAACPQAPAVVTFRRAGRRLAVARTPRTPSFRPRVSW